MHGKLVRIGENELDKIVLDEFEKAERGVAPRRRQLEISGPKSVAVCEAPEEPTEKDGSDIFTKEEAGFIDDVFKWLMVRENRGVILSELLRRLNELAVGSYIETGEGAVDVNVTNFPELNGVSGNIEDAGE